LDPRPEWAQGIPCPTPVSAVTVGGYAETWLPRQRPPFVRPAQQRDYERDIRRCVLPTWIEDETGRRQFGDLLVVAVAPKHLLQLRERLVARRLALKTVRNIMDASLRAMFRDARTVDLPMTTDPFLALTWPRVSAPPPDPFSEAERNTLLDWFRSHRPITTPLSSCSSAAVSARAKRWR
jgi:hypothetical protein